MQAEELSVHYLNHSQQITKKMPVQIQLLQVSKKMNMFVNVL